jgi:hypothetical protein
MMKSKGWKADKYEFQVTVRSVYNLLPGTKRTQLLVKRGSKVAKTQIVDASNGECDFNDEVLTYFHLSVRQSENGRVRE